MKAIRFLLLAALAFSALSAGAQGPAQMSRDELLNRYVGAGVSLVDRLTDLKQWLIKPGDACGEQTDWILKSVGNYAKVAYGSKDKKSEKIAQSIYKYIQDLAGAQNPCFNAASSAYLMASLWIFDRYDGMDESALATTGCNSQCHGPPQGLYLLLLTQALLKAGAIRFAVPQSCAIEFAYLCDPGVIQLNPIAKPIKDGGLYGSSPFDFAGHYIHELDHLFRDKEVSASYVQSHFADPNDPSKIDWKNYLLLDETLAKVFAGKIEIANQTPNSWDSGPPNQIGNDLSLYTQGGPLQKLVDNLSFGGADDPYSTYAQLIGIAFLRQPFNGTVYGTDLSVENLGYVKEIYTIFQNSYFPGVDPDGSTLKLTEKSHPLNPANQSLEMDPLAYLLSEKMWGVNPYLDNTVARLPESDVWQLSTTTGIGIGPFNLKLFKGKSKYVVPIRAFLTQIGTLIDSLSEATPVCQAFNQNLTEAVLDKSSGGALGSYFGGSCITSSDPDGGARPENGGRTRIANVEGGAGGAVHGVVVTGGGAKIQTSISGQFENEVTAVPVTKPKVDPGHLENGGRTDSPARP